MNVIRMAWEDGFLAAPFQFDDPILCLGFWMLVALAGLHQFMFLRILKNKIWHLFLPCLMLLVMIVAMIIGEWKQGDDLLIFVILWYTALTCLFAHGLGTLVHLFIGPEKNESVPAADNIGSADPTADIVQEKTEADGK